jgi:membrane-bound serine protease (ClpP class)
MTFRNEILTFLSDPTMAYMVFIAGSSLIAVEFVRPGRVLPGVGGAVLVMASIHALMQQQWTVAGPAFLLASIILAILSLTSKSNVGCALSAVSWGLGSLSLIPSENRIHLAAAVCGIAYAFTVNWLLGAAYRARACKRSL